MIECMAETTTSEPGETPRVRLIIDTSDVIHDALELRLLHERRKRRGQSGDRVSKSDIVNEILAAALAGEIATLGEPAPKRKKS